MIYEYTNKTSCPNIDGITLDISTSTMINKNLDHIRWDEDTEMLKVFWQDTLSADDKTKLDVIVANNS